MASPYDTDEHIDPETERDSALTEEIVFAVVSAYTQKRLVEATREIISPLVQMAEVSKALKDRALSVPPQGVHPDDLEFDRADIRDALANLIESGDMTLNARGAYELTSLDPEPDTGEAVKHATKILEGWPDDQREKILAVLKGE